MVRLFISVKLIIITAVIVDGAEQVTVGLYHVPGALCAEIL